MVTAFLDLMGSDFGLIVLGLVVVGVVGWLLDGRIRP